MSVAGATWGDFIEGMIAEIGLGDYAAENVRLYFAEELSVVPRSTPLANVVVLQPGQHVVDMRVPQAGEMYFRISNVERDIGKPVHAKVGHDIRDLVVVRSAVVPS